MLGLQAQATTLWLALLAVAIGVSSMPKDLNLEARIRSHSCQRDGIPVETLREEGFILAQGFGGISVDSVSH